MARPSRVFPLTFLSAPGPCKDCSVPRAFSRSTCHSWAYEVILRNYSRVPEQTHRLGKHAVTNGCLAGVQCIGMGYSSGCKFTGQGWNSGLHQGSSPSFKQSYYSCLSLGSTNPAVFGKVSTLFSLERQVFHGLLALLPSSFGGKRSRSNGLVVLHLLLVLRRRGTSSQKEQPFSNST